MNSEINLKNHICEIGKKLYDKGFVAANDGNISIRLHDHEFLITPTGVSKGSMTPEMIIKIDENGTVLEGNYKPSSEMKMHFAVYENRHDVQACVHVHPPFSTAFAIAGIPLDQAIMPESVVFLGTIPVAEYGTPSTNEIPNAVKRYVQNHQGVLLENHGALTWGKDLDHAYYLMESLEFTAKINWIAKQLNGDRELSQKHVETLVRMKTQMGIKGESPKGVITPEGIHAQKFSPSANRSLSEEDLDLIAEKVTKNLLGELRKLF
ncbi:class II aldolase/adducin family protein [Bacillus sp. BRMEA1]|uniref:class II aldolase/adducin family protein n=1 Tax=Neobacillus endophyticus TaxID=2738405 RepID=UPI001562FE78|nr:class II aldolase/adducin family protein [Neobacillus endophyticus]NRD79601.1 class II aldolase/adducin family protein [Neobacillus endophyticus]